MRLVELTEAAGEKVYAYFLKTRGPNDFPGVELHYILPNEVALQQYAPGAEGDERRQRRLQQMYGNPGYTTPSLGFWKDEESYMSGERGFSGSREQVEQKFPNLEIANSREEAIRLAGY